MTTPTDDDHEAAESYWNDFTAGVGDEDYMSLAQAFAAQRLLGQRQANGWRDIASAPRDEMLLSWADGMVRLVMWEAGRWVQVGVTIEPGWYEPTHWMPLPAAPEAEQ